MSTLPVIVLAPGLPLLPVLLGLGVGAALLLWLDRPAPSWTPRSGAPAAKRELRSPGAGLVPEALELLALALQGGGSLGAAARAVAAVLPEPAAAELDEVGRALLAGADTAAPWADAGPRWAPARRCLEVASVAGVPPGPSLRQAATDLRREAIASVEVATARLGVRLVLPLGLAFLPAFVLTTIVPLILALVRGMTW